EEVDSEDLGGINVNDEFNSKVWPKLKKEVDILIEAGIYPYDEEDVESEVEGIARSMKPKFEVKTANSIEINAVDFNRVSNDV
nr:hypothetical protein [Tanacetum cinerariifolium]